MSYVLRFLASILLFTTFCQAQIYNCNGTWTNKECFGKAPTLKEISKPQIDIQSRDLNKKKIWINELDLLRLKAKREHKIQVNISTAEEICLAPSTSLVECSKIINQKEKQINELIISKQSVEQRPVKEPVKQEPTTTSINIYKNEERIIQIIRPREHEPKSSGLKLELNANKNSKKKPKNNANKKF